MNDALTSAEERLVDLLSAMGEVEDDDLESCIDALLEARDGGEDVHLREMLVQAGVVSDHLLDSLLSGKEDRAIDAPRAPARKPSGRAGRSARKAPRGATPDPDYVVNPPELTTPDPDYQTDEPSSLPEDVETRRFDLDALAAASEKPLAPTFPLPALIGGAVLALILGVGAFVAGVRDARPPPPPPLPDDPPVPDDPPQDPFGTQGPGTPDLDLLEAVEVKAGDLEEQEDYLAALDLYRALDPALRKKNLSIVRQAERRLKLLEAHRVSVEQLLEGAAELKTPKQIEERLTDLQEFNEVHADEGETPAGLRLAESIFQLSRRLDEARTEPTPATNGDELPITPEPPERVARFEALTRKSEERLEAVRKRIADDRKAYDQRHQAQVLWARRSTSARPLDITLLPGYTVKGAVIESFTEHSVTLRSGESRLTYAWDSLDPDAALRLRKWGLRGDHPEDLLALGRWCLERRLFEDAREVFAQAVIRDPRLKDQVPDVTAVARASRIFNGRLKRDGTLIAVTYDFERSTERQDWSPDPKSKARVNTKEGRFETSGKGIYLATLKDVGFSELISVGASLGEMARGTSGVVGITFGAGSSREVTYLASADRSSGEVLLARQVRGKTTVVERRKGVARGAKLTLRIEAREDRMRVRLGSRTVCKTEIDPRWDQVRAHIGGASNASGSVHLERVSVRGRVRRSWLRKSFGEFDALLKGLLARADVLSAFAVPAGKRPPTPALSAEDEFGMRDATQGVREDYTRGRQKTARRSSVHLLAASTAFGNAIDGAPTFAAALYRRGLVLEQLGRPRLALKDLRLAINRCPRFFEAMAARGRILAAQDRMEEAEDHANAALKERPDYAPAFSARALARFHAGNLKEALADLDLALALDPWNGEVRTFRKNVSNVLKGPPWERTFREETEHYVVKTDISSRKCAEYARDLEVIRTYYTQRFGEPESSERKAVVLIFDTREGFHSYAELTTDDRVESLLGYYLPRYRQLLLYEDKDDATGEETRRVLYHEAFHQFIEGLIPDIPYWLNEGFADYYSASKIEGGKVTRRAQTLAGRLRDLKRFLKRGGPVPFARLMQEAPSEFYSGPVASKYAQAWSMVHFFLQGASKVDRKRFFTYVRLFLQGAGSRAAFEEAWKGVDWKVLQRGWRKHIEGL